MLRDIFIFASITSKGLIGLYSSWKSTLFEPTLGYVPTSDLTSMCMGLVISGEHSKYKHQLPTLWSVFEVIEWLIRSIISIFQAKLGHHGRFIYLP